MHEKGSVGYTVMWEVEDILTNVVVDSGSDVVDNMAWDGSNGYNWCCSETFGGSVNEVTVDSAGLVVGNYQLTAWLEMDDGGGTSNPDYSPTAEVTHVFGVIDYVRTGNEEMWISGLETNYEIGDDIEFDVTSSGTTSWDTTRVMEWRLCHLHDGDMYYDGYYWDKYLSLIHI